jgi:uncharacterized protein YkwD
MQLCPSDKEASSRPVFQRFLAAIAVLLLIVSSASPSSASAISDEAEFVRLVNDLRASQGLSVLESDPQLTQLARSWTTSLSTTGELSHAPDLAVGLTQSWVKLGENVGVSPEGDVARLFEAFINSPSHYANLVDPGYTAIGVGVVYRDGRMWTTHRFMTVAPQEQIVSEHSYVAPQLSSGSVVPNTAVVSSILSDLTQL